MQIVMQPVILRTNGLIALMMVQTLMMTVGCATVQIPIWIVQESVLVQPTKMNAELVMMRPPMTVCRTVLVNGEEQQLKKFSI